MSGLFITMEGTDGSGKTTQINLLKKYLEENNFSVVLAREPGGTKIGEQIREIILDTKNEAMGYMTEAFLYSSSRAQLIKEVIIPELKNGNIVLCDRFVDSSIAYQGFGRGINADIIKGINKIATGGLSPDITFFLNLPNGEGMERKKEQKELDRLEREKERFQKRIRYGYEQIALGDKKRIKKIDATKKIEEIHLEIRAYIDEIFNIRRYMK